MVRLVGFLALAGYLCAQSGAELFRANCTNCHGAEGTSVAGVDLMHGKFRNGASDNELVSMITKGIAGTAMPPSSLSGDQAQTIVAYLRSRAASTAPDEASAARGRVVFEGKAGCSNCHRVQGKGSLTGPDLSNIGKLRKAPSLERSIVDPNAEILDENRTVRAVTRAGASITGKLLSYDTFGVQLIDSKERLVSLDKSNLRELTFLQNSPMPSYRDKLSPGELADLVSYLVSLKGI